MYGRMYPAARTFQPQYHQYLMNKLDEIDKEVKPWLDTNHSLLWMRSRFQEEIKCDYIKNNVAEVWNKWVKELKDLPIADLADSLRSKFMELYARRRRIGEKFEGHIMLLAVVRQIYALSRELGHLKVKEGGRDEAEVTEITSTHKIIRHVVHLQKHTCTCREWQVSGKPCPHALALITTCRNPNMQEFLDPYFSVYHYRQAYAGVIKPLPDKSQWATVDLGFKLLPPLSKRPVGRQRKNRIPGCLEDKGNKPRTKGKWQVQCKNCFAFGHRSSSSKCHLNGTKKRKSRATVGRPLGQASTSAAKRKKVAQEKTQSPGPVNRRQLALTFGVGATINDQQTTPPRSNKSPAKKAHKKKLTPRKAKK
ncbi:hypothetical protein U9M48_038198 [Paspalum notatum var. saurae]|uniref:SWIM-type domain-containing protein n=1 Tax=Paspalum notatum var. saurae TaxID=547442 RepID=A0AAQ3UMT5_PASNO